MKKEKRFRFRWILNYFHSASKTRPSCITKKECRELLAKSFHVDFSDRLFDSFFHGADRSGEGVLTSDEFVEFFRLLTRRRDLYEVMKQ